MSQDTLIYHISTGGNQGRVLYKVVREKLKERSIYLPEYLEWNSSWKGIDGYLSDLTRTSSSMEAARVIGGDVVILLLPGAEVRVASSGGCSFTIPGGELFAYWRSIFEELRRELKEIEWNWVYILRVGFKPRSGGDDYTLASGIITKSLADEE